MSEEPIEVPVPKGMPEIQITEIFGVKFGENLDPSLFMWIALAVLFAYILKSSIDFLFAYVLERCKK